MTSPVDLNTGAVALRGRSGPEHASGWQAKTLFEARDYIVTSAHPMASRAGARVIERGGNAIDAAIAVQAVLGLVEPQSSSLAGGGFAVVYEAGSGKVHAYDGREACPRRVPSQLFNHAPGGWPGREALSGHRGTVGVPGLPALMGLMHTRHGRCTWADLLEDAIDAATSGFGVTHRVATQIAAEQGNISQREAIEYLTRDDGTPLAAGDMLINPAYAAFLEHFAANGPECVYTGAFAQDFCEVVRAGTEGDSFIEPADFARYRAKEVEVLGNMYRDHRVVTCGGSTGGGIMALEMLGLLDRFAIETDSPASAKSVHLQLQASRLAFADRSQYLADPDFVPFAKRLLIGTDYLRQRASLISLRKDMGLATPGQVDCVAQKAYGLSHSPDFASTTHFSIVDRQGSAVSMTTSIGLAFGARRMAHGMFVNDQLIGFSPGPFCEKGKPVANRAEGGKRPLSWMTPAMVFGRDGKLAAVTGSPGSSAIIGYVVKSVLGLVDWGLDPQACCDLPNAINRNGVTELEKDTSLVQIAPELHRLGHEVVVNDQNSGIHMIARAKTGWQAGCDPRRDGQAAGQ